MAQTPQSSSPTLERLMQKRVSRRAFVGSGVAVAASTALTGCFEWKSWFGGAVANGLAFEEVPKNTDVNHRIAAGYDVQRVISWGDALVDATQPFHPAMLDVQAQEKRFGYNNDYIAYMPLGHGEMASKCGLLCVNHEYSNAYLMFDGLTAENRVVEVTDEQVRVMQASLGCSVVEVKQDDKGAWHVITDSQYNKRITATTPIDISGPARGHRRMQTAANPEGDEILGTFSNCAGGVTPWGSVLSAEENFNYHFKGLHPRHPEFANYERMGIPEEPKYNGWWKVDTRFDINQHINEANRFGWVVEYDPYDPSKKPVKRTALGRFKHECANTTIASDGRVVVYSGDDERFEYVYRFVTKNAYNPDDREANWGLLDEGILSVARFDDDGTLTWLPLIFGERGLDANNGFHSQADVVIDARKAGDIVGATPMDRPEDVKVNPQSKELFIALTNNKKRSTEERDAANPRAKNLYGHILKLTAPDGNHAAERYEWKIFLKAGDPSKPSDDSYYAKTPSKHGWLANPDNVTFDPDGNVWICTDGQGSSIGKNDGVYAIATEGRYAGIPRSFMTVPKGAEVTGPAFTPDGSTLFLSVQHPGEAREGSTYANPSTRWPDFRDDMPPRPSVVAVTKQKS